MERKKPCLIIAEIAQAHDGSVGLAHSYIDAVADAGVDAVKFQTHIAAAESSPQEPWRVKFSQQDATRFDYWKRMEFDEAAWKKLKRHADRRGLQFLSSPFSSEAVRLLTKIGVNAWKIASGEISNTFLLDEVAKTKKRVILSTGMSPLSEIDAAVRRIKKAGAPLAILQCTSAYPCPPEKTGLNVLSLFRERYRCGVGLSDHSGTIFPGLAAAQIGIDVLEVHAVFHRKMFGPDVSSSITLDELAQLVKGVRFIEAARNHPVDKNKMARELQPLRRMFMKSLFFNASLPAGTVLKKEHLILKKPGTGLVASMVQTLVGRRLAKRVQAGEMIHPSHLKGARS